MKKLIYIFFFFSLSVNSQVVLDSLYATPAAFGAGRWVDGGRDGNYYAVTNLNDSGSGSFRDAISTGNRIVIVKVEGLVNLSSRLSPVGADSLTVYGQFAPGRGITLTGQSTRVRNSLNHIFQHLSFQNKDGETGLGSFGIVQDETTYTTTSEKGYYIDHISARYGLDQVLDLIQRNASQKSTVAYNLVAEALEGHNTGSILGSTGGQNNGNTTWARNMYYNISHRFPNMAGPGNIEYYNNMAVNWNSRLSAISDIPMVDYFNNYHDYGNNSKASTALNKLSYDSGEWSGSNRPSIYIANNFVGVIDETPSTEQKNLLLWRKGNPDPCTEGVNCNFIDGDEIVENTQVDANVYSVTQQLNWQKPNDDYWSALNVPTELMAVVGHNRGVNTNGSPGFFRDDKDADYITKTTNGTTESTYRLSSAWDNTSFTGTSLYADTDGDYMPDWFENQHSHLNPNDASDRDGYNQSWDFGTYTVTNNARKKGSSTITGFTNLEMAASFYAGELDYLADNVSGPTCSDGIQNGDETGIDCGGSCSLCAPSEPNNGKGRAKIRLLRLMN